jgi:hypothetical protein
MAISAGSAQAEKGAFWLVSGVKISEALLPSLGGSLVNNTGKLLATIGANEFHITCTAGTPVGAHLVEPNGSLLGQIKFTGCRFFKLTVGTGETELKACEPHNGTEKGTILTNEVIGLILLHQPTIGSREGTIELEPKTGTTFATIVTSEECAFGEKIVVGGFKLIKGLEIIPRFVAEDSFGQFATSQVTHSFRELWTLSELYINKNESNEARIDGTATISLSGAHNGLTWAGRPA